VNDRRFSGRLGGLEFEVGPWTTPLEELIERFAGTPESEATLALLRTALLFSKGQIDLSHVRQRARREIAIEGAQLRTLGGLTDRAREENYPQWYALMEVLQAASLASFDVRTRSAFSAALAAAARVTGHLDRAREAYADAIEGMRIASEFLPTRLKWPTASEDELKAIWGRVQDQMPQPLHLFDPATADPAQEWIDLVLLNSDFGGGNGLLAQIDATFRLAVRLQHWAESGRGPLDRQIQRMLGYCESITIGDDRLLPSRCAVTIADALAELRRWDLARVAYRGITERIPGPEYARHPIALHAAVQGAYCCLMMGQTSECLRQLEAVRRPIEAQARIVITVTAILARHRVVSALCRHRLGDSAPEEMRKEIAELLKQVSILASKQPGDRVECLRTLFYAVLDRDVREAFKIISNGETRSDRCPKATGKGHPRSNRV